MTGYTYDAALDRLLLHEGGYTNHPSDPGGPTNFGITIADYRMYVKPGATANDVLHMRIEDAKKIYRLRYWDAQRCDELPDGVDYAMFDYGVNSGIGRSGKVLRRLLGLPDNTSVVNDAVIAAALKRDPVELAKAICDERLAFLKRLSTWSVFGNGWGRRVAEVRAASVAMAAHRTTPSTTPIVVKGKGAVPVETGKRNATAGGIVVAGGAAVQQSGFDLNMAILLLVIVGGIAVLGFWAFHKRQKMLQDAPVPGIPVVPEIGAKT